MFEPNHDNSAEIAGNGMNCRCRRTWCQVTTIVAKPLLAPALLILSRFPLELS
jgi:hypothetical protein